MAEKRGTDGKDKLTGTTEADDLFGYKGNDRISGDAGDDYIVGHEGKDKLTGGLGADEFVFARKSDLKKSNLDTITDFNPDEDVILLDYHVFKHMGFGELDDKYFHVGKSAKTADQHIIFNPKDSTFYYDKDGDGDAKQTPFVKVPFLGEPPKSIVFFLSAFTEADVGLPIAREETGLGPARLDLAPAETGLATAKVNVIKGGNEDDSLLGTKKDDKIVGGDGDDEISGGTGGKDLLIGGAGADDFFFMFKGDLKAKNMDTIKDFSIEEDTLNLSYKVFKNMGFGPIEDGYVRVGNKAIDDDDYLLVNKKNGVVSYDADANGKGEAVQFLKFKGIPWDHISGAIQNGFMSYNPEWEN